MPYYIIVDNGVGNYVKGQYVDGEALGDDVDRLLSLNAIALVSDEDIPEEAVIETAEEPAEPAAPAEEPAPETPPAPEPVPNPFP